MNILNEDINEQDLDNAMAAEVVITSATERILQKILNNIDDIEEQDYELAFSKYILNMLKPQLDKLKQNINKSLQDDNQVIFEVYFNSAPHHKDIRLYIDMEFDEYIPHDFAVKIANASQIALGMKAQVRIISFNNVAEIFMLFDDERFNTLFNKVKEKVIKEINELPNTKDLFVDDKYFEKAKERAVEIIDKLTGDTSLLQ